MYKSRYDVIIVGSGIGGLVCGNYLVKFVLRSDGGNVKTVYWPFIVA